MSPPPHALARGVRPDAEAPGRVYLVKQVAVLRATYQIRLLAFLAAERGSELVLRVPASCRFDPGLEALARAAAGRIRREDLP
jgi:hypothetical protein